MKDFLLLFRQPNIDPRSTSPKDMQALDKKWQAWVSHIAPHVSNGQRLSTEGKVLKAGGVITDGPFVEIRERLGGFMVVKAESLEDATTMAHGCPALEVGGSVEIRQVMA